MLSPTAVFNMELLTISLILIACTSVYYFFKKRLNYFEDRGIPYVPAWPLLGNFASPFFRRQHIKDMVDELYNSYPEARYMGAFDFMRPAILIRDLDLIKSIAIKSFDNFPDHKIFIDDSIDPLFGGNLFSMAGDRWKEARALLSPAFTSSKMKGMYEMMVKCAKNFLTYIDELPADKRSMVATKDLFTKLTTDIIATCAFGIEVDSLKHPNNDFYILGKEATNFDGIQTVKIFIARLSMVLVKILNLKFVSNRVRKFFTNIVQETVNMRDEKKIVRPDMIQLMMDARERKSEHLKMDITEMTAQAFIFFFGGFDTTSRQMCIIAHELALNQEVQKKLHQEIDEVMQQSKGSPTYEQLVNMPYLDAVFNESLRVHTQFAFLDRLCRVPFELPPAVPGGKPYVVPEGMNVWIPSGSIHKDPKYYDNPKKFDPDRYYHKKVSINDVTNLGFGIGPRSCIGNRFAILETKVLFFFLLSKYSLMPNKKTANPFVYDPKTFNVAPKQGFWLSIEPRN